MQNLKEKVLKSFASDNWSGVCKEVMDALIEVNRGHHPAYGEEDFLLENARQLFKREFGEESEVFFVYNGTAANVLSIRHLLQSWEAVITPETSHLNQDEAGAPEKFAGVKLLTVPTVDGKIRPDQVVHFLSSIGFQHHVQPRLISISQSTELGTVYHPEEIRSLSEFAHQHQMYLHMDGARISNAAVSLGLTPGQLTKDCGVDVLSFGGTKNGLMFGEAIVFINGNLARGFPYNRKQGMQLASKMRYIIAQFIAYLSDDLWKRNASHANRMAKLLGEKLSGIPGLKLSRPVEANAVFVTMSPELIADLQKHYFFHVWNEETNEVRLMCSYDTQPQEIDEFVSLAAQYASGNR